MKRFSGLYDFWHRGKRLRLYFFSIFVAKMTFTISRTVVTHHEVTKLLRARNIIGVLEAPTARCVLSGSVLVARNRSVPVRSGSVCGLRSERSEEHSHKTVFFLDVFVDFFSVSKQPEI